MAGETPSGTGETGRTDWHAVAQKLGQQFATRIEAHDTADTFVAENYTDLKEQRVFSAGIPADLGGGGASFSELCDLLHELALGCDSTALALAMHTHLLAAAIWRWRQGQPVESLLRRIADEQLVLVSTGASDWLDSSGRAEKVEGGYRVTARKIFGSGSPAGSLLMTSAVYDDPQDGATVLHFPVPMTAGGVTVLDNWRTLGMRATGSNDVMLDGVFVPDAAVSLRRPKGRWHPFFNVVLGVAEPLIMSVYLGVAERAAELARDFARRKLEDPHVFYLVGELENSLTTAQLAARDMIAINDDYGFPVTDQTANAMLIRKTIAARAVLDTVEKAMEVVGGAAFFRAAGLERLLRDAHGAQYHPLPEKRQLVFTGRVSLGLDPVGQ
jgi:alkylation response protein AidB-like acyl-CoA dehydrogenase